MSEYELMDTSEIDANETVRAKIFNIVLESGWPEVDNSWPEEAIDAVVSAALAEANAEIERLKRDNSGLHEIQDTQRTIIVERDRRIAELESLHAATHEALRDERLQCEALRGRIAELETVTYDANEQANNLRAELATAQSERMDATQRAWLEHLESELATARTKIADLELSLKAQTDIYNRIEVALTEVGMPDSDELTWNIIKDYFGNQADQLATAKENYQTLLGAVSTPSEVCRLTHNQQCLACDRADCGDNTTPSVVTLRDQLATARAEAERNRDAALALDGLEGLVSCGAALFVSNKGDGWLVEFLEEGGQHTYYKGLTPLAAVTAAEKGGGA